MSDPVSRIKQYVLFFSIEVAAMALILWDGLPIYRHLIVLERVATRTDELIMWTAVGAIQFTYWYLLRHEPPFTFQRRALLAHIVLFVSRLSFVFASSLFALVAYRYSNALEFDPRRIVLFIAILFSVFCFSRHLEAIGNLMLKGPPKARAR
jgi:hypothetical protein